MSATLSVPATSWWYSQGRAVEVSRRLDTLAALPQGPGPAGVVTVGRRDLVVTFVEGLTSPLPPPWEPSGKEARLAFDVVDPGTVPDPGRPVFLVVLGLVDDDKLLAMNLAAFARLRLAGDAEIADALVIRWILELLTTHPATTVGVAGGLWPGPFTRRVRPVAAGRVPAVDVLVLGSDLSYADRAQIVAATSSPILIDLGADAAFTATWVITCSADRVGELSNPARGSDPLMSVGLIIPSPDTIEMCTGLLSREPAAPAGGLADIEQPPSWRPPAETATAGWADPDADADGWDTAAADDAGHPPASAPDEGGAAGHTAAEPGWADTPVAADPAGPDEITSPIPEPGASTPTLPAATAASQEQPTPAGFIAAAASPAGEDSPWSSATDDEAGCSPREPADTPPDTMIDDTPAPAAATVTDKDDTDTDTDTDTGGAGPQVAPIWNHILGQVEMTPPHGGPIDRAREKRLNELLVYLQWRPLATADDIVADIYGAASDKTLQQQMSLLRTGLGTVRAGGPKALPPQREGRYSLEPVVRSDWQEFERLVEIIVETTPTPNLIAAMDLVTGRPLGGIGAKEWSWSAGLRDEIRSRVPQAAVVLAERLHAASRHSAAASVARKGLWCDAARQDLWRIALLATHEGRDRDAFRILRTQYLGEFATEDRDPEIVDIIKRG